MTSGLWANRALLMLGLSGFLFLPFAGAQGNALIVGKVSPLVEPRLFFPHNWIRGYTDFQVAPTHNEPDLGRCALPPPGVSTSCTAFARYLISGYIELQPIGRGPVRHFFLFFEPKMSFGRNIPQVSYLASMEPIAFDRSIGIGFQMPHGLELRVTQHQVDFLGRYSRYLGPEDLRTAGPYGLYATVGIRWSFGGYAQAGKTN